MQHTAPVAKPFPTLTRRSSIMGLPSTRGLLHMHARYRLLRLIVGPALAFRLTFGGRA